MKYLFYRMKKIASEIKLSVKMPYWRIYLFLYLIVNI